MFALVWWCYPIVMACVAVPMAFFWFIENRRDAREDQETGPFPCLAYMGRDVHMGELWCWLLYGHDGDHADQSELPDTAFTREWPDEDLEYVGPEELPSLPPLPQRLSKVPTQGNRACKGTFSDPCPADECWDDETGCTRDH